MGGRGESVDYTEWKQTAINPLSIQLDDENPRIAAEGLSQEEIRLLLLEHEDVAKLAHKISQTRGVFPHDLLVIGSAGKKQVVFEGNRRIAALQMLLNPKLIPNSYADKLPRADAELRGRLASVPAVVAPDRQSADRLIAQIHALRLGRHGHRWQSIVTPIPAMRRDRPSAI